ncbi:MAG: site-specific integrase, partial [Alphaproteobacteria bacterium]|nr:site-specific integrase [Alphaproteobacteria bacterium]
MHQYNPDNERIKKQYFTFLAEADVRAVTTIDAIRKAVLRFETQTGFKDFKTFNKEQAVSFKNHLAKTKAARTGEPLSKSTTHSTLSAVKDFFKWLAYRPGYKSSIDLHNTEYFNLSEKDVRIAKSAKFKMPPTIEQIRYVIQSMPDETDIQRRNRALIAFTALTGLRDGALASLRLRHVETLHDPPLVKQEPDTVKTKFSKRIDTYFFPVGDDFKAIALDW